MQHLPAQAMVLAAGRGERMRPLTDTTPKPLLLVRGKPLMQWTLEGLVRGGVRDAVVNTAWLGQQISGRFGPAFQHATLPTLQLHYSHEGVDDGQALETAGGIVRALPLLDSVFWVAAADVFAPQFIFSSAALEAFRSSPYWAHLWLVPNPDHNGEGDFGLSPQGRCLNGGPRFTFSTIALYKQAFFTAPWCAIPPGNPAGTRAALAPMLRSAIDAGYVSGTLFHGDWTDVGTPQRLAGLQSFSLP